MHRIRHDIVPRRAAAADATKLASDGSGGGRGRGGAGAASRAPGGRRPEQSVDVSQPLQHALRRACQGAFMHVDRPQGRESDGERSGEGA